MGQAKAGSAEQMDGCGTFLTGAHTVGTFKAAAAVKECLQGGGSPRSPLIFFRLLHHPPNQPHLSLWNPSFPIKRASMDINLWVKRGLDACVSLHIPEKKGQPFDFYHLQVLSAQMISKESREE
jgi:hypothetical protein